MPFSMALLWTFYSCYNSSWHIDAKTAISAFGASFFFFSWMTGQFFRVRKQVAVERSFNTLETRVESMIDKIEIETNRMISNVTGGKSFAYIIATAPNRNNMSDIVLVHVGDYPLQEISISIADLDKIKPEDKNVNILEAYHNFNIRMLSPGRATPIGQIDFEDATEKKFNIFFVARNGSFVQMLRMEKHNGNWETATKVVPQDIEHDQNPMFEKISEGYPVEQDKINFS